MVTDEMVEAFGASFFSSNPVTNTERHREEIRAAMKAAIKAQWMPMDRAPKDGTHCILSIPMKSGFVYSVQGKYRNGKWMNAMDYDAEPLAWMPNVLLPDELCPWPNYKYEKE